MSLDRSILEYPVPLATQAKIANQFWAAENVQVEYLRLYFQYYAEQCRIVFQSHKMRLPLKQHQDLVDITTHILDNASRSDIKRRLTAKYEAADGTLYDALDASIDLAVRLVFMLDVGEFPNAFSGRRKLVWLNGSTQEFMQQTFPVQRKLSHGGLKLGRDFNVSSMVRIAGFNIELTTNLADHLRLRDADKTVMVFHHASFLRIHQQSSFFPTRFIDETLATLALLFPQGDRACKKWYNKQDQFDDLDHSVLNCGSAQRRMDTYRYWHDRLVILKEEFDESRPSTLSQWWNDRREGTQWYTLWVAIVLTLLFGLIQSIVGAMQLYKAYYP
ncbi:hypothetical protein ASPSYDRAFT_93668 [Aspergillus sydowii CBS 593.65]|uniref:Uncharacterized protein n=1 Tax=Aspergillus sydowii CBS 593.65 TaxID=1036612 RepID=A0A1L9T5T9_9EURO|nr:uncharacterized protein ASPSYDRAFT_93668 [Aspergillus sydowii CBS 593.65]OJJ54767.1 hypothetical protein ASPSYDRAFT_93668 [Aspergillus sydowii CBS 593.65]